MITETEKQLYKKLAVLFGGFQDFIQGAGGNISIKTETQIIIKASGTCLSEADQYIVCALPTLQIVEGSGKPSMEVGFHLLPKRIIVHFHSLSCLPNWQRKGTDVLSLPYIQPGELLSTKLHAVYKGESIVHLANHGMILFAETEEEIYTLLASLYPESFFAMFRTMKEVYEQTSQVFLELPNPSRFLFFRPFTPDSFLFLKRKPLRLSIDLPLQEQLQEYEQDQNLTPSIVYLGTKVFALAISWKKCILIRDMYDAYCKLIQMQIDTFLNEEDCNALLSCEKEAYRLRL